MEALKLSTSIAKFRSILARFNSLIPVLKCISIETCIQIEVF